MEQLEQRGPFVDSHVNLHHEKFAGDLDAVVARARESGVVAMLTISDKRASTGAVAAVAGRWSNVWRTVGVHPHHADDDPRLEARALVELAAPDDVVGIGECGLDFHYEYSGREAQFGVFRAHVAAARETGLPLVIHARGADAEMRAILIEERGKGPFVPLLHCYTGGVELARAAVDMGGYVSFAGILTFRNADDVRAIAAEIPLDRLLIETDCPYLAPVPYRGRRAEPAHVALVAEKLADLRGMRTEALARATTENFFRLFSRARPEARGLEPR